LPQRHQNTKKTFGYCSSLRLGGVKILPPKAQKLQLSTYGEALKSGD
jgi:hypothetical protein